MKRTFYLSFLLEISDEWAVITGNLAIVKILKLLL